MECIGPRVFAKAVRDQTDQDGSLTHILYAQGYHRGSLFAFNVLRR